MDNYHSQHGLFIVPRSGIYLITATILHDEEDRTFHGAIYHQGHPVVNLVGANNEWEQSTQTVLIQANPGDEIWVRN